VKTFEPCVVAKNRIGYLDEIAMIISHIAYATNHYLSHQRDMNLGVSLWLIMHERSGTL